MAKVLKREFYTRRPEVVAKQLLGKLLIRHFDGVTLVGRIVETEAYSYPNDPASHAYRGKTKSNAALFGEPGHAYIYFVYGNHYALNVVSHKPDHSAGGVLIRALEPIHGIPIMEKFRQRQVMLPTKSVVSSRVQGTSWLTSGPGKLAKAFAIDKKLYGIDVTKKGPLYLVDDGYVPKKIVATPRIGISKSQEKLWRFVVAESLFLSKKVPKTKPSRVQSRRLAQKQT